VDLPGWVRALGLNPMFLGLDLRGGIHVLIDVDMEAALDQALERYVRRHPHPAAQREGALPHGHPGAGADRRQVQRRREPGRGREGHRREFRDLNLETGRGGPGLPGDGRLPPPQQAQIKEFALQQNITTLRNRVNALGVAEPNIAQQGERRIVVQLPGAQDPGRLKEILGATATLEYRLVDTEHSVQDAEAGRVPVGSKLYKERDGRPVLLNRRVIVTGDQITDAAAGFDQQSGSPPCS
jgi:preprotein translocase subunit SecD